MEKRASIPPGLPRQNPTISYWQDPPDAIADHRSTTGLPEHADIIIIGSGITGATIAFNILEQKPETYIVLLEARQACSGASGRNGKPIDLSLHVERNYKKV
jgi:choline dehydrogenase-like flavoprotein